MRKLGFQVRVFDKRTENKNSKICNEGSLINNTFVSDVCHILPSKFLPILYTSVPILNPSLNWPVPSARELIEWTASAHVVDQNRVNGTEADPSARQATVDLDFEESSMSIHRIVQPVFH